MKRRSKLSMSKLLYFALALCGMVFLMTNSASALDISLAWDPSPGTEVVGYKLYYQANSPNLPLSGSGALQGGSPVDVGNGTGFSLTGLPDSQIYYFAVTAYDAAGYESAYSNIVASGVANSWVPMLFSPANNSANEPVVLQKFDWEAAPYDVRYTLYYGTNPQLTAITPPPLVLKSPKTPLQTILIILLLTLLSLTMVKSKRTKPVIVAGALTLALGLSLAGCGGGGGSTDGSITLVSDTVMVKDLNNNFYDIPGTTTLKPATTYYWKVVATDKNGLKYESVTNSFTTAAN